MEEYTPKDRAHKPISRREAMKAKHQIARRDDLGAPPIPPHVAVGGFDKTPRCLRRWLREQRISITEFGVLSVIHAYLMRQNARADYIVIEGFLDKECGLSSRQVRRHVRSLLDSGFLLGRRGTFKRTVPVFLGVNVYKDHEPDEEWTAFWHRALAPQGPEKTYPAYSEADIAIAEQLAAWEEQERRLAERIKVWAKEPEVAWA